MLMIHAMLLWSRPTPLGLRPAMNRFPICCTKLRAIVPIPGPARLPTSRPAQRLRRSIRRFAQPPWTSWLRAAVPRLPEGRYARSLHCCWLRAFSRLLLGKRRGQKKITRMATELVLTHRSHRNSQPATKLARGCQFFEAADQNISQCAAIGRSRDAQADNFYDASQSLSLAAGCRT